MTTYYHGGVAGLRVGDSILPPTITGARPRFDLPGVTPECRRSAALTYRRDRVYLITRLDLACRLAVAHVSGTVYRVRPAGVIELDPDWVGAPGVAVMAPSAEIVEVMGTGAPGGRIRAPRAQPPFEDTEIDDGRMTFLLRAIPPIDRLPL